MELSLVTATILVGSVCCASKVKEQTFSYSCCDGARIKFDPTCELTWSANDMDCLNSASFQSLPVTGHPDGDEVIEVTNFAHTKDDTKMCVPPCKEISDGEIVLDSCQPVNVTITCITENNRPEDTIISYLSNECQHSGTKPGSPCLIGSLVLTIIVAQLLKWMMH